jgi:hypothetical protein
MTSILLALLLTQQSPATPEAVQWSFKRGQDFFVEETQRYLLSSHGNKSLTSYADYTMLWRYYAEKETASEVIILATLEKIRVNNSTEAGGKASELLKLQSNTKSRWKLTRDFTGWQIDVVENTPRHVTPYILILGTNTWTDTPASWTQEWSSPSGMSLPSKIVLRHELKEQTSERTNIRIKAHLQNDSKNPSNDLVEVKSHPGSLQGIGEFDRVRNRWVNYEFWVTALWKVNQGINQVTIKQDNYCNFRIHEKRPTFP